MGTEVRIKSRYDGFSLDIDFQEDSKRIGILGASGAGKSLTLKTIAGIERPDYGRIVLNGRVLFDSEKRIDVIPQKRSAGYLFQNYALFPNMTVFQNIAAGLHFKDREKISGRTEEMISTFRLQGLENRLPSELSGGQQQRVALARIMAYDPEIILLDEPFSALDIYLKDRMQEELKEMLGNYEGTVIMVSHSRDEIYRFSERLLILDEGRVLNHGDTKEIFAFPGTKAAAVLTGCKNISAATVLDEHVIRADDWGIQLTVKGTIPPDTKYLGYRAHEFEPIWGEREENCIRFSLASEAELQFERNYYIRPEGSDNSRDALITWFVQRHKWEELDIKGMPSFLKFKEKDMLFLR
ncbi:MAG: ATP-binding cassette domain-containing protein [Lachnospiraceae bacterium]|nr:ATP-binding cassette domain-containing protein [Lachnospiraceae bacterium]